MVGLKPRQLEQWDMYVREGRRRRGGEDWLERERGGRREKGGRNLTRYL
jgi:hypothetical protein